ncbi:PREDICTED: uncharacterized protein LOC109327737 [Lupinus angustifolius]|uniref:uncharacterized protein LOC109327737 n=1 Tax=Lupinus angustifolius TaxID=3871 RepID=UPI00092F0222|nr:PREDICTED: uncharacterized protein LOC109327737 [Lupinus angustifolius]
MDIHNPYYMHSGEHPSTTLVTQQLDGTNYNSWSRAMRRALCSKNKYKFIDGSITTPEQDDPSFDMWDRCNTMIISWIIRCLSPTTTQSIVYIENAQELWHDLRERFSKGDRDISNYFTDLKTQWEELKSLRPMPSCTCSIKCKCGQVNIFRAYRENEYVLCFLKGLNEEFNTTRTQIRLMEPLPTINKAFSLIIQYERQIEGTNQTNPKVLFNSATRKTNLDEQGQVWRSINNPGRGGMTQGRGRYINKSYKTNNGVKFYAYCGKDRHTIETCLFKHGFLLNSQQERQRQSTITINNATSPHKDMSKDPNNDQVKDTKGYTLGPEQYAQLTSLLKSLSTSNPEDNISQLSITYGIENQNEDDQEDPGISGNSSYWVLDSGATDHVCPNLSLFDAFKIIKPISISFPNDSTTLARI